MGQRHVWVREQFGPRHMPGLILAWRHNLHGEWEAFVTWDNGTTPDGQLETDWVPAERLQPATGKAPSQGTAYG